jgi:hypothetical protein
MMKKKLVMFTGAALLLTSLSTPIFAEGSGHVRTSTVKKPAPVSASPIVKSKEVQSLEWQVSQLEQAVAPSSPKEAVETWSKGIKTRNGALQYAAFTKEMRKKAKPYFDKEGWTTGGSSPWIAKTIIAGEKKTNDTTYEYTVQSELASSTGYYGKEQAVVTTKKVQENWYVASVILEPSSLIGMRTPYTTTRPAPTFTYRAAEFAISFPQTWDMNYHAVEKDGNVIFYYKPGNPKVSERVLFSIEKIKESVWKGYGKDPGLYKKLGAKDGYVFAMLPASENQYADRPDSIEYKEYQDMALQMRQIPATFMLGHQ